MCCSGWNNAVWWCSNQTFCGISFIKGLHKQVRGWALRNNTGRADPALGLGHGRDDLLRSLPALGVYVSLLWYSKLLCPIKMTQHTFLEVPRELIRGRWDFGLTLFFYFFFFQCRNQPKNSMWPSIEKHRDKLIPRTCCRRSTLKSSTLPSPSETSCTDSS